MYNVIITKGRNIMDLCETLETMDVDINEALGRFMGNKQLLEMMYKKMPDSINKNKDIIPDIQAGNIDAAIQKAHTLKGNMGNLSIKPMYEAYAKITEQLRAGDTAGATEGVNGIQEYQNKLLETLSSF